MPIILGFFGVVIVISALCCLFRELRSSLIIREVCSLISKELLRRMAAGKVSADQLDCMEIGVGTLYIKAPYEVNRALGITYAGLDFKRKNGGKVYLGEYKQQKKLAKQLISALGLVDYTFMRKTSAYSVDGSYTSTLQATGSGVEVTTHQTVDSVDAIIICRKDRAQEFFPKKGKDCYL